MRRSAPASHNRRVSGGFPHSDIPGSKGALASPGLIAECHVLHRLLLPRHPPNALIALDPIQKKTGPFARGPGSEPQPAPTPVGSRLDPAHPKARRKRQRSRDRRRLLGQCHRLGKTVLVALPPRRPGTSPRTAKRRTRPNPHSGRTQNVSCYCSLHDVTLPDVAIRRSEAAAISRSDRKAHAT